MPKGGMSNFSRQSLTAYIARIHADFFLFFSRELLDSRG